MAENQNKNLLEKRFLSSTVTLFGLHPPLAIFTNDPIVLAIQVLVDNNVGSVLVLDDNEMLKGIFTERDLLQRVALTDINTADQSISRVMTPDPYTIRKNTGIGRALYAMSVGGYRHLPVVHADKFPVGVVSIRDVVTYIYQRLTKKFVDVPPIFTSDNSLIEFFLGSVVGELLKRELFSVLETDSVKKAVERLKGCKTGCVAVLSKNGDLAGIFSERDYLKKVALSAPDYLNNPVQLAMTSHVKTATYNETVANVFNIMAEGGFRHLPILDKSGRPVGIISVKDLLDRLANYLVLEIKGGKV